MDAIKKAGVRALVSAGWGGLGGADVPDEVFILKGRRRLDLNHSDGWLIGREHSSRLALRRWPSQGCLSSWRWVQQRYQPPCVVLMT